MHFISKYFLERFKKFSYRLVDPDTVAVHPCRIAIVL
jgi:hypothetical protein